MNESLKKVRVKYHKQELEELTGAEWAQKVPPTLEPLIPTIKSVKIPLVGVVGAGGKVTKYGPGGQLTNDCMNIELQAEKDVKESQPVCNLPPLKTEKEVEWEKELDEARDAHKEAFIAALKREPTVNSGPGFIAVIAKESVDELKKDIEGLNVTLDSLYGRIIAVEQRLHSLEQITPKPDIPGGHKFSGITYHYKRTADPLVPKSINADDTD